jgi:hypothetical protein
VVVQTAIALLLAVLLTVAGRAFEAVGRALRRPDRHPARAARPLPDLVVAWPSRLLAAGLGSRAPPRSLVVR